MNIKIFMRKQYDNILIGEKAHIVVVFNAIKKLINKNRKDFL